MASWVPQSSPAGSYEVSPAESFLSLPGEPYPSLFASDKTPATTSMDILEIMTPTSFTEEGLPPIMEHEEEASSPAAATADKKVTKKRKSWGQVLPEPKTNLPPRKRAKTEDEKEQRRVERVLRNRRAAQSSRERKRQEVEGLEARNQNLQRALEEAQKANQALVNELKRIQAECGVATRLSNDLSLSQPLFSSQDATPAYSATKSALIDEMMRPTALPATVDPARLSPDLAPVPDEKADRIADKPATSSAFTSVDMTQRPAVSSVNGAAALVASRALQDAAGAQPAPPAKALLDGLFGDDFSLPASLDADSLGAEVRFLAASNQLDLDDHYLATDSSSFANDGFDIAEYLDIDSHEGVAFDHSSSHTTSGSLGIAARSEFDQDFDLFGLETRSSPEAINLQPQPGASARGCDAGGLAVGSC